MTKAMNVVSARFQKLFRQASVSEQDAEWFPMWLERYAQFLEKHGHTNLLVDRDWVIRFLQSLRDSDVPAWQRLQAVRAIACYQRQILKVSEPDLGDIETTLAGIANSAGVQRTVVCVSRRVESGFTVS